MILEEGKIYTDREVVQFVQNIHYSSQDFVDGDIQDRIEEYDSYQLKRVKVIDLEEPCYYVDEDLIEEYKQMNINNIPPLVLGYYDDNSLMTIDGGHRTTILKELQIKDVLAFVGIK